MTGTGRDDRQAGGPQQLEERATGGDDPRSCTLVEVENVDPVAVWSLVEPQVRLSQCEADFGSQQIARTNRDRDVDLSRHPDGLGCLVERLAPEVAHRSFGEEHFERATVGVHAARHVIRS